MGGNISPIRQRQLHVIDTRFITNVVLSVYSLHNIYIYIYIYIWTIYGLYGPYTYIEHINILNISTCAGGLSHR